MADAREPDLGEALRDLRLARGLSLGQAAERSGASKAALSMWEAGTRRPRGPALARLLDALAADERTRARLLRQNDLQDARIVLADSSLGRAVDVGAVLRVLRRRRGVAQADLARMLGTTQATISKWESGDVRPSTEAIHALGYALGATVEETLALASVAGTGGGGLPDEKEDAMSRMRPHLAPYALREAVFLGWEAELARRAAHDARWDPALVLALARRAEWLVEEERYDEIAAVARRAIRLATTPEARLHGTPAVAALADADRRLGRGHKAAAAIAGEWAADLPASQQGAWMLRQRGMSLVRMGRSAEGVDLVARSAEMDLSAASHALDPWSYRVGTVGEAHLEAGEPRRAMALLDGRRTREFDPAILVRIGHANGRAATEAEMAYLRHAMAGASPSPLARRRRAEIERRQTALTGVPAPTADPVVDPALPVGEAEEGLWAAVLREHRG